MAREFASRIAALIPVLIGMSVIVFLLIRLIPGNVVDVMLAESSQDPVVIAELRRLFGLDLPIHVQFWDWFSALLRGDMGTSLRSGQPVLSEIGQKFPATLELAAAALIVSLLIGVPIGILSAVRRNGVIDFGARFVSLVGLSLPNFWQGILLIVLFAVTLRWLPAGGYVAPNENFVENLRYLALPAFTLGTGLAAVTMRMTRSALLEVLGEDYVRTARAKGLDERTVVTAHALRNALIPVVTVVGIQAGRLLAGTVIVETVFSWPGLGSVIVRAIFQRDYPLVQGAVLFLALFFVLMNLLVDFVYVYLDPRLRRA